MVAALYRRYRPETFAEMIGQQQVTEPLSTAIRSGRINHAYLFSGPRGCGKTSSARILARCLNCAQGPTPEPCGVCESCVELGREGSGSLDVLEIDAASHGGVDDARELRERAVTAPTRDRYRIFIIDEAHMVTPQGFNALLKVVEEPPEHVLFIFATTEPEKVIGTIRSRTHHYPFRLIAPASMLEYLEGICAAERVSAEPGVLPLVVRAGGGSARDTLSLLDQLIAGTEGDTLGYQLATQLLGFTAQELLDATILAFADGDARAAFRAVDSVIQSGQDPRRFVEDLLERVRDLIIVKAVGQAAGAVLRGVAPDELDRMVVAAARFQPRALTGIADAVNTTLTEMVGVTTPRLQLELMIGRILVALRATFATDAADRADGVSANTVTDEGEAAVRGGNRAERPEVAPRGGDIENLGSAAQAATAAWSVSGAAYRESTNGSVAPVTNAPGITVPVAAASETGGASESRTSVAASGSVKGAAEPEAGGARRTEVDFDQVRDAWPSVLEGVQRLGGRGAWSIVRGLRPLAYREGILDVWFPNRGVFEQAREGNPAPAEILKRALGEVFGVSLKVAPKIERGIAHERADVPGQGASVGAAAQQRRGAGAGPAASSSQRATASEQSTGEPVWRVAAIPGEPRIAEDGPGSAWDEFATANEALAQPPQPQAAETVAAAKPTRAPQERVASGADASEPGAVPAVQDAAQPVGTWNVAVVPGGDSQEPPAAEPTPETLQANEPVSRHPATLGGQQRYGESVIRELLGARFVGEQPREPQREAFPEAPDDFAAPPEEY